VASWDAATDADPNRVGLRCLACGRRLEDALALAGSLRCLDCRESKAALQNTLAFLAGVPEHDVGRKRFWPIRASGSR